MAAINLGNVRGLKGDKGDKGDTGATGAKGDKGDKGDAGEQLIIGVNFPPGEHLSIGVVLNSDADRALIGSQFEPAIAYHNHTGVMMQRLGGDWLVYTGTIPSMFIGFIPPELIIGLPQYTLYGVAEL